MNETQPLPGPTLTETEPPPTMTAPPPTPGRPPLRRSRTNRVAGGVCGGLGAYFDIDPVLIRVLFVVLTIFTGGLWALVWLVLLLAIPEETAVAGGPYASPQPAYAAGGTGQYVDPRSGVAYGPPPPPAPREPTSYLGLITVSAALVVGGVLALLSSLGAHLPAAVVLASMLGVLGVGLLVGAVRGRARWLVALAVPLLLVGILVTGVSKAGPLTPIGERNWRPTATTLAPSYDLGTGDAVLDLRGLSGAGGTHRTAANVSLGQLRVLVPADVRLALSADVRFGELTIFGQRQSTGSNQSASVNLDALPGSSPATTVELDAHVGVGNLEVRRAAS